MASIQQQQPMMNYGQNLLKDIPEPHAHDVLCGRGGGTNNHIGNSHWRMLVAANKQLYITLPKRQKMLLSRSIVNAVRSQNPPGRFLQKDGKTKLWFDVGDQRAQEKTSQALREGAPDIRKKVAAAKATGNKASSPTAPAPTSDDNSNSGVNRDGGKESQIPAPSSTASPVVSRRQNPESAASSTILQQTARSTGNEIIQIPDSQFNNSQQEQQQQQVNTMYVGNNVPGHMTLNERGVMVQNAMMNGTRSLNGQSHLQINNNERNYQQSHPAYNFQQHHQQSNLQQKMHPQQYQYQHQYQYHQHQYNNNVNYQQQNYRREQQQLFSDNRNEPIPAFDNFDAAPPEELERDGLSFGSLHMTDNEMYNLQQVSNHGKSKHLSNRRHSISEEQPQDQEHNVMTAIHGTESEKISSAAIPSAPMGGVLEPTGISIGDVSMQSVNTNLQMKLEDTGNSFGTMMSFGTLNNNSISTNPDMVDGGLMDAVGTSFGSLSLDKNNRDMLFKTLEISGGGQEVPPMFRSETKATANLLDCSDTESESSREKEELTKQKSQAWEMMKTQLDKQTSKGASVDSQDLMPPPVGLSQDGTNKTSNKNHGMSSAPVSFDRIEIALPPTTMEANFSNLSAWSATGDNFNDSPLAVKKDYAENTTATNNNGDDNDGAVAAIPPPPPELTKVDSF